MHELHQEHEPMEADGIVTVREAVTKHDRKIEQYVKQLHVLKQQLAACKTNSLGLSLLQF